MTSLSKNAKDNWTLVIDYKIIVGWASLPVQMYRAHSMK